LAAGVYHTCALRRDSSISCWGGSFGGQLGDGLETSSPVPVTVLLPP
jgi:alpha-tubulin suppressor-like RCC1 family protein